MECTRRGQDGVRQVRRRFESAQNRINQANAELDKLRSVKYQKHCAQAEGCDRCRRRKADSFWICRTSIRAGGMKGDQKRNRAETIWKAERKKETYENICDCDLHLALDPTSWKSRWTSLGRAGSVTERLYQNWNEMVSKDDIVIVCGDISWALKPDEALV